eukprot:3716218-Prymnesium_polylepis.1
MSGSGSCSLASLHAEGCWAPTRERSLGRSTEGCRSISGARKVDTTQYALMCRAETRAPGSDGTPGI